MLRQRELVKWSTGSGVEIDSKGAPVGKRYNFTLHYITLHYITLHYNVRVHWMCPTLVSRDDVQRMELHLITLFPQSAILGHFSWTIL
jgi:hypothetical protein